MAHSVDVWESDPQGLHYHPVGYMQISSESMRADIVQIFEEQQSIGYDSEFIEGAEKSNKYMLELFSDWFQRQLPFPHSLPEHRIHARHSLQSRQHPLHVHTVLSFFMTSC